MDVLQLLQCAHDSLLLDTLLAMMCFICLGLEVPMYSKQNGHQKIMEKNTIFLKSLLKNIFLFIS